MTSTINNQDCEQVAKKDVVIVCHDLSLGWVLRENRAAVWSTLRDSG